MRLALVSVVEPHPTPLPGMSLARLDAGTRARLVRATRARLCAACADWDLDDATRTRITGPADAPGLSDTEILRQDAARRVLMVMGRLLATRQARHHWLHAPSGFPPRPPLDRLCAPDADPAIALARDLEDTLGGPTMTGMQILRLGAPGQA